MKKTSHVLAFVLIFASVSAQAQPWIDWLTSPKACWRAATGQSVAFGGASSASVKVSTHYGDQVELLSSRPGAGEPAARIKFAPGGEWQKRVARAFVERQTRLNFIDKTLGVHAVEGTTGDTLDLLDIEEVIYTAALKVGIEYDQVVAHRDVTRLLLNSIPSTLLLSHDVEYFWNGLTGEFWVWTNVDQQTRRRFLGALAETTKELEDPVVARISRINTRRRNFESADFAPAEISGFSALETSADVAARMPEIVTDGRLLYPDETSSPMSVRLPRLTHRSGGLSELEVDLGLFKDAGPDLNPYSELQRSTLTPLTPVLAKSGQVWMVSYRKVKSPWGEQRFTANVALFTSLELAQAFVNTHRYAIALKPPREF